MYKLFSVKVQTKDPPCVVANETYVYVCRWISRIEVNAHLLNQISKLFFLKREEALYVNKISFTNSTCLFLRNHWSRSYHKYLFVYAYVHEELRIRKIHEHVHVQ